MCVFAERERERALSEKKTTKEKKQQLQKQFIGPYTPRIPFKTKIEKAKAP